MAFYGYAWVSSNDQDLALQTQTLRDAGCEIIRSEKARGTSRDGRTELQLLPFGSDLPSVYVSVVEVMPVNEVNVREIERKALQTYQDACQRREFAQTDEQRKIANYQTLPPELTITQRQSVQKENAKTRRQPALAEQYHREMDRTNKTVSALSDEPLSLREKDIVAQRVEFTHLGKENWKEKRRTR